MINLAARTSRSNSFRHLLKKRQSEGSEYIKSCSVPELECSYLFHSMSNRSWEWIASDGLNFIARVHSGIIGQSIL